MPTASVFQRGMTILHHCQRPQLSLLPGCSLVLPFLSTSLDTWLVLHLPCVAHVLMASILGVCALPFCISGNTSHRSLHHHQTLCTPLLFPLLVLAVGPHAQMVFLSFHLYLLLPIPQLHTGHISCICSWYMVFGLEESSAGGPHLVSRSRWGLVNQALCCSHGSLTHIRKMSQFLIWP